MCDGRIHDLLGSGRNLRVRESADCVSLPEAVEVLLEWEQDLLSALVVGLQRRTLVEVPAAPRRAAPPPPRACHCVFTLSLWRRDAGGDLRETRLQLVELAAEAAEDGAGWGGGPAGPPPPPPPPGDAHAALSRCLAMVVAEEAPPYRDSKLTWLCRDALGGSLSSAPGGGARLTVLACCSVRPSPWPSPFPAPGPELAPNLCPSCRHLPLLPLTGAAQRAARHDELSPLPHRDR